MKILSTQHYTAFGQITHFYASIEFGIKAALTAILEVPFIEGMIVTNPYSSSQLKDVAKSLTKESLLSADQKECFVQIIGDWSAFGKLRNQIAHNRWQKGERENTVRAVGLDIRAGKAKWIVTEDSPEWTVAELFEEAGKLAAINERLQRFHDEVGLYKVLEDADKRRDARKA